MLTEAQREQIVQSTRTLQIIVVAIFSGAATFLGIALALGSGISSDEWLLSYLALAAAFVCALLAIIIPSMIVAQLTRVERQEEPLPNSSPETKDPFASLLALNQTRIIVRTAILEGAAFLCIIAYFSEGHRITVVAAVALLVLILLQFPTLFGVEAWVTRELESREQLRQLSSR